jgi:hypothetical protein
MSMSKPARQCVARWGWLAALIGVAGCAEDLGRIYVWRPAPQHERYVASRGGQFQAAERGRWVAASPADVHEAFAQLQPKAMPAAVGGILARANSTTGPDAEPAQVCAALDPGQVEQVVGAALDCSGASSGGTEVMLRY